ncbi:hypothetical protein, partial [Planobispora rosea]
MTSPAVIPLPIRGLRRVPGSPGYAYRLDPPEVWEVKKSGPDPIPIYDSPRLPWCPEVSRHLVTTDSQGTGITSRQVTITVGEHTATLPLDQVADGTCWNKKFVRIKGRAGREIREVLLNIVEDQAFELPL